MNVKELIEKLQDYPPETIILVYREERDYIWGGDFYKAEDICERTDGVAII
jgi:uncharacterized protein YwqG